MKIAITGGAGFIGRHLVELINSLGHEIEVIDNFSTGDLGNMLDLRNVKIHCLDITKDQLPQGEFDAVIHLASPVSVQESLENPEKYRDQIWFGSKKVFDWAKENGVKKIVAASTAAVYGDNQSLPLSENYEVQPMSPYAKYKFEMEKTLMHSKYDGIQRAALRFFNVYGEGQNDGSKPNQGYVSVIPIFLKQSLAGKSITVTGTGQQTRDFVYVKDVCEAIYSAITSDFGSKLVCNVGSGKETKVIDIANTLSKDLDFVEARNEPYRSLADTFVAEVNLGWKAKTNLLEWLKKHTHVKH